MQQMAVVTGVLLAGVFNLLVQELEHGWRVSNSVVVVVPLVIVIGVFFLPESPRWLYLKRSKDKAKNALTRLRGTSAVEFELHEIQDQVVRMKESGEDTITFGELWTDNEIRPRVVVSILLQCLQQATGINPILTYGQCRN